MTAFKMAFANSWSLWAAIAVLLIALWYPVLHEWWTERRGR